MAAGQLGDMEREKSLPAARRETAGGTFKMRDLKVPCEGE